jgi:hypothetical protein
MTNAFAIVCFSLALAAALFGIVTDHASEQTT